VSNGALDALLDDDEAGSNVGLHSGVEDEVTNHEH
jgi:hypothetical protein